MTDARITLDATALARLRGRTFLPGPVTTDRLVEQSRAALDLRDRVATLEAEIAAAKDSLRSHDAEVLERAAVKCDEIVRGHSPENARVGTGRRHETKMLAAGAKMCAAAIRALAAQEVTK